MQMPLIGLGTWELRGRECAQVVKEALELGYRHIDTASAYENHKEIGKGIKGFPREQLFITSKISLDEIDDKQIDGSVEKACDKALKELRVDYLDLYLIHWPDRKRPLEHIAWAMQHLKEKGKVRSHGVSNFTVHHLEDLMRAGLEIFANQVEFHPYLYQKKLLDYCKDHRIQLVAFRPFGKGKMLSMLDPIFDILSKKYQKTPAQIILKWILQKEVVAIPKASSERHLKENQALFDFSLLPEEEKKLDNLNQNKRFCSPEFEEFNY